MADLNENQIQDVTAEILEHMMAPKNYGQMENPTCTGMGVDTKTGEFALIYLQLDGEEIFSDIKYGCNACQDTVIAGSPYNITGFDLTYDPQTHKIDVECSSGSFIITFPTTETSSYKNGIGYNLGFTGTTYTSVLSGGTNKIFPEIFPDVIQDKYIYVSINDWNLVQHQSINQTYFPVFAKVQLPGTKNTIVFDSNYTNSSTKEYFFQQPVNIQRLEIKLLDSYGNVLEMNGDNWSMTLELRQVNDSATYEALNIL
jgi:hypothetical protein